MTPTQQEVEQEGYIKKAQAAEFLCIKLRTLESYMKQGIVPYTKIGRGRRAMVLFRRRDIVAKLEQCYSVGLRASP